MTFCPSYPIRPGRGVKQVPNRVAACAAAIGGALLAGCALGARGAAHDPHALWLVVHDACVPDQRRLGSPSPCAEVGLAAGYAVLKDINGPTQFLLIPTARVSGIEDPALLSPEAPNYWAEAWRARRHVERRADRPLGRDEIALAVNSAEARTQDQLHIHIDCVRPAVRAALRAHAGEIGARWAPFPVPLAGDRYLARWVDGPDLAGADPFRLLAALPRARAAMGRETLVVTGATAPDGRPGFILLAGRADPATNDRGSGEALQDHRCALARPR